MVAVGYTLMCEQTGPKELVAQAVQAEEAGFDYLVISDHYYPWLTSQGHSPYAWAVLGAVAHATSRIRLMTLVTCPIRRYHPAVVAQKAATVGVLSDGRFTLSLGAGENLNEHVVGAWPHVHQRHEMFEEALQIIRPLLDGENLSFAGHHFEVPEAYLWDRPETRIPIAVAASGPHSVRLAAEYGDALVCDNPDAGVVRRYDEIGGAGRPRYGQVALCYGPDTDDCRTTVHEQWRWATLNWSVKSELPGPESFRNATEAVRPADVAQVVPCGPDLDAHVAAVRRYVDAGFTDVALVQVGVESQPMFLDWARDELLPRLREV
ncbi:TIGR03557 family F420-dependent LLM class oxidoreductase [Micromonospora sp. HM5-17]|jgi:G6PDH family F420-dependent oxidoreductase|uniref:TIGR03557 family F420-dependent LLM class oxidoreductase n=1 Tax=Micromonospora sp. HM5-17 TaxID=2487710 RepID=UPI000F47AAAD|nr:TIGR03557 family F420-dependent LLM class oxidoreductase [Micromonospora sp. HM5-17]ROT33118.1 TIGR03557 family F420-dependent LLM class oxidoreductase [Micromonospora sp. HM5-17]